VASSNPPVSPSYPVGYNRFTIQHLNEWGRRLSDSTFDAYTIFPVLPDAKVELLPSGASNLPGQAIGSKPLVRISFKPAHKAQAVRIRGTVRGQSFRFEAAVVSDESGSSLTVNSPRSLTEVSVSTEFPMNPGQAVSVLLTNIENPLTAGTSFWDITTFESFDPRLGHGPVSDEKLRVQGFDVVGDVPVQARTSSVQPNFYNTSGATLDLQYSFTEPMATGDRLLISAPTGYTFASNLVIVTGAFHIDALVIVGPTDIAGTYARQSQHVYRHSAATKYLYWRSAVRTWIFGNDPAQAYTGDDAGQVIVFAGGSFTDPVPPVTTPRLQAEWRQSNASGARITVSVMGEATILSTRDLMLAAAEEMAANAGASLVATVDLPASLQLIKTWLLRTQRSQDVGSVPPRYSATNEYGFVGFRLLWHNYFEIVPKVTASSALVPVLFAFDQPTSLPAKNLVTFILSAPAPISFPANCFSEAEAAKANKLFDTCKGGGTTASLTSNQPLNIKGFRDVLRVELMITLSSSTPSSNNWTLSTVIDQDAVTVPSGFGTAVGFEVTSMAAALKGCNQITVEAPAYFTFTPEGGVDAGSEIVIEPPTNQGFTASCFGLGFIPHPPICNQRPGEESLTFTLQPGAAAWSPGLAHTVSFGLTSAPRQVPDVINIWKITIRDATGAVRDSNHLVPGIELSASRLSAADKVTYAARTGNEYTVTISVKAQKDIPAGSIAEFRITAPTVFRMTMVKTDSSLPTDGHVGLESSSLAHVVLSNDAAVPAGEHVIEVSGEIMKPPIGAFQAVDPSWLFQAVRSDGKLQYQKVMGSSETDPMYLALSDRGSIRRLAA
jgi:hypothetical protein